MKTVRNCRITTLIGLCCTSITCSMLGIQTVQASTTVQGNGAASGAGAVGRIPSVSPGPSSSPSNTPTPSNGSQASVSGQLTLTAAASPRSTPSSSPGTTGSSEPTSTASSPSNASSHTVTFDCNMQSAAPATSTVTDGAQVARPSPEATRRGFVLEGWFAGKVAYDFSAPVHSDLTLKAKWARAGQTWTVQPQEGTRIRRHQGGTYPAPALRYPFQPDQRRHPALAGLGFGWQRLSLGHLRRRRERQR